ncbi:hypothetical protein MBCUT_03330 [Methanobrevibacter cuticularis]|uniref:Uncharacterized protein n=1 Tax=Methanobrevibacter cuticularis TaxID=47311 RepID=A0A166F3S9_9EURY|nr:hypothetical protein [Methanobrevibacter cuticularis]KZX17286.1 hypothetical protein MBCUT_03330 [Methanobrevibacter cuticularis]
MSKTRKNNSGLLKSDKKHYSFRLSEHLMDELKNYAELKGNTVTEIITESIEDRLNGKVLSKYESDNLIPVYLSEAIAIKAEKEGKDLNESIDEILGYIKWNNHLDVWNGSTYCYNTEHQHRGLGSIKVNGETKYVRIITDIHENNLKNTNKNYLNFKEMLNIKPNLIIAYIIPKSVAIRDIVESKNYDLLIMYPELHDKTLNYNQDTEFISLQGKLKNYLTKNKKDLNKIKDEIRKEIKEEIIGNLRKDIIT